jgi:hypothetical protein
MTKGIIRTILLSIAAAVVTAVAVLFCLSLRNRDGVAPREGWNMVFMLPENAALTLAVIFILLDIVLIVTAVVLLLSAIKLGRIEKVANAAAQKPRFSRLNALDRMNVDELRSKQHDENLTLQAFADGFREFAAGNMGLYYEPNVIRTYIAAMAASRLTILQGISGTGKTSLPYAFGQYVDNPAVITPVQPSWKDRTDLLGYYNEFTDSYTETELLYKLYEANRGNRVYTVVLDEMNIARVEYYFAEFLSLLELPDKSARRLRVTSDSRISDPELFSGGTMLLPDNVWFAGTANNDDSTLAISDKVYDRAFVIDLNSRCEPFPVSSRPSAAVTAEGLRAMFDRAAEAEPLSSELRAKFERFDKYISRRLGITFGNRTMKQLERFVPVFTAAGGNADDAADAVICHKILRKLEGLDPSLCRREAEGLKRELAAVFGAGRLPDSEAYIDRLRGGV